MSRVAIVYWSGTGNTEAMANAVADGVRKAGAEAVLMTSAEFDAGKVSMYDAFAFGCPAMGAEVLEEEEFQPMWDSVKSSLGGKKIGLFGSYGWGSCEWMSSWAEDAEASGITLASDPVTANESPDDDAVAACNALGAALA